MQPKRAHRATTATPAAVTGTEVGGIRVTTVFSTTPTQIGSAFFQRLFWDMRAGPNFKDLNIPPGTVPEFVGNADFKMGLGTALSGSSAILGVANFAVPNQNLGGIILNLDPNSLITTGLIPVNGSGAGTGTATFFFPIPNNPAFAGTTLAYQWFVLDPLAPAGLACSQAATFTVF